MLRRCALLVVPALLLAGCASPLNSFDTGHCHAEHRAVLDTGGSPWAFQKVAPHEDGINRVYTWGLDREGGCVGDVHLQVHGGVVTGTAGCAGVDLAKSRLYLNMSLAPFEESLSPLDHEGQREWLFDHTYSYGPDALGDQPQAWHVRLELTVFHEDLVLSEHIDDCVHASLRAMEVVANDHDFRA
ncbi:MAG: hypothetical protein LC624_08480 [Halobacteriales archaeon]|nr:hypothetical protein [Halobacteriales archaeon]